MNIEPKRDPRPRDEDGVYHCYDERCDASAEIVTPRRIEATGPSPYHTVVTYCLKCYLAWEVLGVTRKPLDSAIDIEEEVTEEFDDQGYMKERLYPRLLANVVLFDDPRGHDPPPSDSPRGNIFDHAGKRGEEIKEKLETPIEDQLQQFDELLPDSETEESPPGQKANLDEFT